MIKLRWPAARIVTVGLVVLAVVGLSWGLVGLQVLAQGDPPPAGDNFGMASSDVQWTVGELAFQSNYPAGFQFQAEIRSSAGPIVRGRVIWSHVPGTQRSRPVNVDPDTGTLTAVWDATGSDAVPPWVGLMYYWDVGDSEGNAFQTEPQYVEYEDTTHDWVRTETDDIIVFAQNLPDEVGPLVADAMAAQREMYRAAWGGLLPYKPRAILFGSRGAWLEWQITTVNYSTIGLTSDDWGGTGQVVSGGGLTDLAYGTVLHEVAHLYQNEFTLMVPGSWLIEGNATFFELNQQYNYESSVRHLAASGNLPVLLQGTGPGVSGRNARRGYDIGYTFWKWLVDNYGLEGHRQLIELLDQGIGRVAAIETVTGLTAQDVESRWRTWLGASALPPTLVPTPTFLIFPTIAPLGY
ncbi:MAG: hypothetical protein JXQ72_15140 [Anaerolineae bacterium]|nr:hypothetical protein [Anaerolineae bacterium]